MPNYITSEDNHTIFEKHNLKNGQCQLVIKQNESMSYLFDYVFENEKEANEYLFDNWDFYCKVSAEIYYAGVFAMEMAYKDFKERWL